MAILSVLRESSVAPCKKISDAVSITLTPLKSGVIGSEHLLFETDIEDLYMPFLLRARRTFTKNQLTVLFQVRGDLYMLVSHYEKTGTTSVFILNSKGHKLQHDPLKDKTGLLDVVVAYSEYLVKAFHYHDGRWDPLSIEKLKIGKT